MYKCENVGCSSTKKTNSNPFCRSCFTKSRQLLRYSKMSKEERHKDYLRSFGQPKAIAKRLPKIIAINKSEEGRKKNSDAQIKRWGCATPEQLEAWLHPQHIIQNAKDRLGIPLSEEHKNKIRETINSADVLSSNIKKNRENWVKKSSEEKQWKIKRWHSNDFSLPNKPEKQLIEIFSKIVPNEYEYVGNHVKYINGFNPDFICESKRLIIEHFGDYWHGNPSKYKDTDFIPKAGLVRDIWNRDAKRLTAYKKAGYRVLIVWLSDLTKNPKQVESNIINFHNGNT